MSEEAKKEQKIEPLRIKGSDPDEKTEAPKPKKKAAPKRKRGRPTKAEKKAEQLEKIEQRASGFRGTICMGFAAANMGLSRLDAAMDDVPKEKRPIDSFQFKQGEIETGVEAITDYIREVHPEWLEAAPAGMALLMWSLGCIGPRLFAGAQLYKLKKEQRQGGTA